MGPSGRRDPYRSMVSEFMLQQTQVSRVVPAFDRFIARFPDVRALAGAPHAEVLRFWEGLGYYRRAGLLHRAAIEIVASHAGEVPSDPEVLRTIPGIGAYTAGSIASLVFGVRTPLVDANVRRVLMRIDGREVEEPDARREAWAWERAEALVALAASPGALNEGLMELGALHCLPRSPVCEGCPVAGDCRARAAGAQDRIPRKSARAERQVVVHQVVVIRDRAGRLLIEQRPREGMWAGLWQFPTRESAPPGFGAAAMCSWAGVKRVHEFGAFDRATTHRAVRFRVWTATGAARLAVRGRTWVTAADAEQIAFSVPQRLILARVLRAESGEN